MYRRFLRNHRIIYREETDGAFLFDPRDGNLKYMNRIGKEIFLLLSDDSELNRLVEALRKRYPEASEKQIQTDVETFLEQLLENGFVFTGPMRTDPCLICVTAIRCGLFFCT